MNPVPRLHYACSVFLVGHPYVPLCSLRRVFHKVAAEKFDAAGTLIAYPDMHMRGFKRILSGIPLRIDIDPQLLQSASEAPGALIACAPNRSRQVYHEAIHGDG